MGETPFVAAETEFGKVLLKQGLATPEQIKECLAEIRRLESSGSNPVPKLLTLLYQKGYLDLPKAEATIIATPATGGPASTPSSVAEPEEVARALDTRENVVGKYVRVARLGAGGMGEVWRAWDRELGRWVALKFIKSDNPNELARFQREAQTSARLSHPNITAVYGVGEDSGRPFIAMQLIQGSTLAALRKASRRQIVELVRDAALAVQYAHQQGIIHRDLKPANIMVEGSLKQDGKKASGGALRVFVMDFGLAKQTKTDSSLSVSGSILGTPAYMSPEQARGRQNQVDARSDVYSLGATLYDLLAHQPPFKAQEAYELLRQVIDAEPRPLREIDPRIDADLETIVAKCLEKERLRRYASAEELAKDLQRFLDGEPILARPTSVAYRLRKRILRNRALSAAIAAAVLIALVAAGVLAVGASRRSAQREADRKATEARASALRKEAEEKHGRKDWAGALESLGQYLAMRPADERAQGLKADCDRALKEQQKSAGLRVVVEEAAEMSRRASENIKEAKALLRVRASRREQWEKLLQEAEEIGDSALKKYPDLAGSHYTVGEIRMARNRWREAIESFDRAIKLDATLAEAWRRRGLCIMELFAESILMSAATRGDTWGVAASPARRATLEPLRNAALENFEKYAALRKVDPAATLEARTLRAAVVMSEGRYAEGETACDKLLEEIRTEERIWLIKTLAQHAQGRYTEALATMNTVLADVVPHDARCFLLRGWTHMRLADWKSATSDVNKSIEIDPTWGHSYLVRASIKVQFLDLTGAIKDLSKGIELDPKNPYGYSGRAYANLVVFKNWRAAADDATRSLELHPYQAYPHWIRGTARLNLNELEGADADFTRAVELEPSDMLTLRQFIAVRARRDDRSGAIKKLNGLIDQSPRDAALYHLRAVVRAEGGEHADALPDFDLAVNLAPKAGLYRLDRGRSRAAREDWEGAGEDFAQASALLPRSAEARVLLGDARLKRGDAAAALKAYDDAVRVDPKSADALVARGKLLLARKEFARALKDFEAAIALKPDLQAPLSPLIEECRKK